MNLKFIITTKICLWGGSISRDLDRPACIRLLSFEAAEGEASRLKKVIKIVYAIKATKKD